MSCVNNSNIKRIILNGGGGGKKQGVYNSDYRKNIKISRDSVKFRFDFFADD